MTQLLVKPDKGTAIIHEITPQSAGWNYVGFTVYELQIGQSINGLEKSNELCFVLLQGQSHFRAGTIDYSVQDGRKDVFSGQPPYSLYVPPLIEWSATALSPCCIAVGKAPHMGQNKEPRMILPNQARFETRGKGANMRYVRNILPETEPADSLLVVEVLTPSGHWSSYPPHKHDKDDLPHESALEEVYYHLIKPKQGFVTQRVYTDDRTLDKTMAVEHGDVVLVPQGYHPVGVPYGYESYYLNIMAGPNRLWRFHNDPAHEWLFDL